MINDNLPPHDVEAEKAVLGSLLIDSEGIFKVAIFLRPEDFFSPENQWIYDACFSLYQRNEGINQITVAHELAQKGRLEEAGGAAYLSHLVSIVPTSLHVEHFAQIVSRTAVMRRLISAGSQITALGYEDDAEVDVALSRAEDILFKVRQRQSRQDFVPIRQILGQYFEETGQDQAEGEEIPHILTSFAAIDDILGGLQRSDLIILGARPSVGKTSLALNIARNTAVNQKACVALFSLEMSRQAVVQRLLSNEANVDSRSVRLGTYTEREERKIMEASGILSEALIYIDDSPQLRVVEMRGKAQRLYRERTVDLVIVDYLQLIQGSARSESRVQELSDITRSLKALAREIEAPVLAISQLSRAIEWRSSHKPQLSDLRDSGSIEQDADVVLFISREEMYVTEDDWKKDHDVETEPYPRGIADLIVAKHRNGPTGEVKLRFVAKTAKFEDLEAEFSAA
ncbi:MAG: replicative DNA helicase [Chloroflexi bacterium RBG_19FT_COMBO_48_23]|nr:MAG: replicative DNA helicase [Chloroflexi bacterium RBG_19FT_COMBO_48_23]